MKIRSAYRPVVKAAFTAASFTKPACWSRITSPYCRRKQAGMSASGMVSAVARASRSERRPTSDATSATVHHAPPITGPMPMYVSRQSAKPASTSRAIETPTRRHQLMSRALCARSRARALLRADEAMSGSTERPTVAANPDGEETAAHAHAIA